jgi:nucleoside-diphosphate-sugar epimerase
MVDMQNRLYKEQYGCNFTSVIPTNIFGPHDNYDLEDSKYISQLVLIIIIYRSLLMHMLAGQDDTTDS